MIDWERVQELREEVGHDDFKEVVEIFLEEVEDVIARLRNGTDTARLEEDFHFLKGSALNLGFAALAQLCRLGESRPDTVEVAGVVSTYESSKVDFLSGMQSLGMAA